MPGCKAAYKQSSSLSNHKKNVHRQNANGKKRMVKKKREYEESISYDSETSFSSSEDLSKSHQEPSFVVDYSRIHPFVEGLRAFGPIFRYEEKEIEKDENFDTNDIIRI